MRCRGPAAPERERFVPPWYADQWSAVSHGLQEPGTWVTWMRSGRIRLPRFQRPWVWHDEQIVRLFDSMLHGYHVGSLLLWERYDLPASRQTFGALSVDCAAGSGQLVVDGQQRLGALATMASPGRFYIHLLEGRLVTTPGPWCVPAAWFFDETERAGSMLDGIRHHADAHNLDLHEVADAVGAMLSTIQRAYLGAVRLGTDWTLERVVETFKRLNTEGTRMAPDELAAGLRRAMEVA